MNKLPIEKQIQVIQLLLEGIGLKSASAQADVSINTTTKLLLSVGKACEKFHHLKVKGLTHKLVALDQIWSIRDTHSKMDLDNIQGTHGNHDIWTWVAVGDEDKIVLSWYVGSKDSCSENIIVKDIFTRTCDTAQLVWKSNPKAHKPTIAVHQRIYPDKPSTKKREEKITNLYYALALHFVYFNFCKIDQASNFTPAMRAGIIQTVMNVEDIIGLLENNLKGAHNIN